MRALYRYTVDLKIFFGAPNYMGFSDGAEYRRAFVGHFADI